MSSYLLHARSHGAGRQTIVLLHGYLADSAYWKPILPALSQRFRVITLDLLGFGASPKPRDAATYTLKNHAEAVHATLDTLDIADPITLVGHSMGAIVAAEFARRYPSRVKALRLLNMPIYTSKHQAQQELLATNVLYRTVLFSRREQAFWVMTKLFVPVFGPKKLRAAYSPKHSQASRTGSLHHTIIATNTLTLLQSLRVPTVLVEGTYDRLIYKQNLSDSVLPAAVTLKWLPSGHHTVHSRDINLDDYLF